MKNICFKLAILGFCSWFVVASSIIGPGGGSGGGTNTDYQLLNSTADKTSILSGMAELSNNANDQVSLNKISGTLKHDTGALSLNNGSVNFNATGGNKSFSDGNSTLTFKTNFKGDYKYMTTYQHSYKAGSDTIDVSGIVGVATHSDDIARQNNLQFYKGEAEAVLTTSELGVDLRDGTSELTADFGTGKVSVTLTAFTAIDLVTGQPTTAPFANISISDMKIDGNAFSGGTFKTLNGVIPKKVVGKNESATTLGGFFGTVTDKKAPVEVGGQFLLAGDDGQLSGTFMSKIY